VGPIARRGVRRQLQGHGIGLHSPDEIYAIGRGDIRAIAGYLGTKSFLMGETASEIDAIAYGFLANIARAPIASPLKQEILQQPSLADYLQRIDAEYFGQHAAADDGARRG
jgi:hypothetical protein